MKIGIDIHGTADAFPEFFREISKLLVGASHEVHIVTGIAMDKAFDDIDRLGLACTHVFSVVTHHQKIGSKIEYRDTGPWMDDDLWNRSKAEYAKRVGLDIMIDDSDTYGALFDTPYMKVSLPAAYQFQAANLNELETAADMLGERGTAVVTGKQIMEAVEGLKPVWSDLEACHRMCTALGAPDLGGGIEGLRKRLEHMATQLQKDGREE